MGIRRAVSMPFSNHLLRSFQLRFSRSVSLLEELLHLINTPSMNQLHTHNYTLQLRRPHLNNSLCFLFSQKHQGCCTATATILISNTYDTMSYILYTYRQLENFCVCSKNHAIMALDCGSVPVRNVCQPRASLIEVHARDG